MLESASDFKGLDEEIIAMEQILHRGIAATAYQGFRYHLRTSAQEDRTQRGIRGHVTQQSWDVYYSMFFVLLRLQMSAFRNFLHTTSLHVIQKR